jgi:phage baseplate assembly protein W
MALWSDPNQYTPNEIPLATDIDAIYQSIENILSTGKQQRVFKPWLGAEIEKYLFEIMDRITALAIEHEVIKAIGMWEPRVVLQSQLTSIIPRPDDQIYEVRLVFKIIGRGDEQYEFNGILDKAKGNSNG